MAPGRFITVEGVEGAGKSTQLPFIRKLLSDAGREVITTREPGGTELGESLRRLLLAPRDDPMAIDTELLLVFAARAEHLYRVIRPALAKGKWVLCDRFTDATYAYQGGGRCVSAPRIATLEEWVQGDLRPDLTIILDVPVEIGMRRIQARSEQDRFEQENPAFFERIRSSYLEAVRRAPGRCKLVDASGTIDEVRESLQDMLGGFLRS